MTMAEKEYYPIIKEKLEELMKKKYGEFYLEITADKHFSNKLKAKISKDRDIIFNFLRESSPDITGFIKNKFLFPLLEEDEYVFIVIEVKKEKIKLDNIYQIRKYSELFNAWLAILITLEEIPEEIKRLSKIVKNLLPKSSGTQTIIAQFNARENEFKEWFPKNPFR
jgi:hypothetical protein